MMLETDNNDVLVEVVGTLANLTPLDLPLGTSWEVFIQVRSATHMPNIVHDFSDSKPAMSNAMTLPSRTMISSAFVNDYLYQEWHRLTSFLR